MDDYASQAGHVHVASYDEGDGPNRNGAIRVTERCECGAAIRTYLDWVI